MSPFFVAVFSAIKYSGMTEKIKWLVGNFPKKLFTNTAESFQKHLNDLTKNKYDIQIIQLSDYQKNYCDGNNCKPLQELKEGRIHLSSVYSNSLGLYGATDFYALILPYIFESERHSDRILTGNVGKKLLTHLYDRTGIHGLGFNWIKITKEFYPKTEFPRFYPSYPRFYPTGWFRRLEMEDKKMQEHNPIMNDITDLIMSNILNVADASHSTYLTTIVCNAEFMHSLSKHDKENFLEASRRTSTINQITESLSKHEIEKLREPWAPLYEKYMNYFSFDIIDEIKNG
jgi:hypothetical protein